jgi:carboxymethylenebutenolidase
MTDVEAIREVAQGIDESELYVYPADHGFNCDQRASYDAPSAATAWQRSVDFLRRHLG